MNILWSGGIDSTCMLCAFLYLREANLNLKQVKLNVVLNKRNIKEYPLFFNKFIHKKVKYSNMRDGNLSKIESHQLQIGRGTTSTIVNHEYQWREVPSLFLSSPLDASYILPIMFLRFASSGNVISFRRNHSDGRMWRSALRECFDGKVFHY